MSTEAPPSSNVPDGDQKPAAAVKPALKAADAAASSSNNNNDKHLQWDEAVIEEHDLLRGTRMKIDEPNTPYTHYDSGAESDGSNKKTQQSPANQKETIRWDVLQNRLDTVKAVQDAYDSEPEAVEKRRLEFVEHRKRHYNEMELVKKFREEHPDGGDDDEEKNDADDES